MAEVIEASGYRPRGIVQAGANKGREAERYLSLSPDLIVWIEADTTWMPALNKLTLASPPATRQIALNALIADRDGVAIDFLRYSNKGWASSTYRPTKLMQTEWPGVGPTGEVVPMTSARLETVLAGAGLSPADIDALALDVGGAELEALKGAGAFLAGLELIQVKLYPDPYFDGGAPAEDVVAFLERAGFRRLTKLTDHGDVVFRRAVHAVLGGWGKHLFEHVGDPRVVLTTGDRVLEGEAELIVVPCGSADDVLITEEALPESVWQGARAGRAGVIFDASTEAIEHSAGRTADLHGFLAGKGISPGHAVYLTQDRDYRRDYLAFCAASGIGETM
ncbi:MAG TPA: FkbM family methyltransferase, partial [Caulobacteraceae bacterium]|nr:FkbM family methyltransferase [Caulobacteraceae bacterium]